jgi:hypothetical protein
MLHEEESAEWEAAVTQAEAEGTFSSLSLRPANAQ